MRSPVGIREGELKAPQSQATVAGYTGAEKTEAQHSNVFCTGRAKIAGEKEKQDEKRATTTERRKTLSTGNRQNARVGKVFFFFLRGGQTIFEGVALENPKICTSAIFTRGR